MGIYQKKPKKINQTIEMSPLKGENLKGNFGALTCKCKEKFTTEAE